MLRRDAALVMDEVRFRSLHEPAEPARRCQVRVLKHSQQVGDAARRLRASGWRILPR
jgi:hypothetical protein